MSTHARHIDSTNPERVRVMMATGRIRPKVVTESYLEGLTDEACRRYRTAMDDPSDQARDRYIETRLLLIEERERWRRQGGG